MDLSFLYNHPQATTCFFQKGEYLFHQGDPANCIYVLVDGMVERIEFSESGDEIIFGTKSSHEGIGAIVGLNNLWVSSHISFSSFLAVTPVQCVHLPGDTARALLLARPHIVDAMLYAQMENYMRLRSLFKSHRENRVPNLLAALLINSAVATSDGLVVPKEMTNIEMSRRLGVHQVTIAKIMMFLQKERVLERTPQGIRIVDEMALQRYAQNMKMRYK